MAFIEQSKHKRNTYRDASVNDNKAHFQALWFRSFILLIYFIFFFYVAFVSVHCDKIWVRKSRSFFFDKKRWEAEKTKRKPSARVRWLSIILFDLLPEVTYPTRQIHPCNKNVKTHHKWHDIVLTGWFDKKSCQMS